MCKPSPEADKHDNQRVPTMLVKTVRRKEKQRKKSKGANSDCADHLPKSTRRKHVKDCLGYVCTPYVEKDKWEIFRSVPKIPVHTIRQKEQVA